jgi:hypothetical protein
MGVRVTNLTSARISLPDPLTYILKARELKEFEYIEYDTVVNIPDIARLQQKNYISIYSLDPAVGGYDSAWNGPRKFHLGLYQLWMDAGGSLRTKNGDALFDLDGVVIGPGGGGGPHGATHVFNGTDPIPNIETLEDLWICPAGVAIRDVVYEFGANNCDKANASTIATMPAIGVVMSKPTPTSCVVARSGEVAGFGVLTADVPYFVGTIAGTLTSSAPAGTGRVVQPVGYARNTDVLVVELGPYTVRA